MLWFELAPVSGVVVLVIEDNSLMDLVYGPLEVCLDAWVIEIGLNKSEEIGVGEQSKTAENDYSYQQAERNLQTLPH